MCQFLIKKSVTEVAKFDSVGLEFSWDLRMEDFIVVDELLKALSLISDSFEHKPVEVGD